MMPDASMYTPIPATTIQIVIRAVDGFFGSFWGVLTPTRVTRARG
jgi:hypothetical protein